MTLDELLNKTLREILTMLAGFFGVAGQGGVAAQPTQTPSQPPTSSGGVTYNFVCDPTGTIGVGGVTHTSITQALADLSQSFPHLLIQNATQTLSTAYVVSGKIGASADNPLRIHFADTVSLSGNDTVDYAFKVRGGSKYIEFKGVGVDGPQLHHFIAASMYLFSGSEFTGAGDSQYIVVDNIRMHTNTDVNLRRSGTPGRAQGILNGGHHNTVKNCEIYGCTSHGIYGNYNNSYATYDSNNIHDNDRTGIRTEGTHGTITNNTITDNGSNTDDGGSGIGFFADVGLDTANDWVITGNTLTSNAPIAGATTNANIRIHTNSGQQIPKNIYIKNNTFDGTGSQRNIIVVHTGTTLGSITYDDAKTAQQRLDDGKVTSTNFTDKNTIAAAAASANILPSS